MHWLSYAKLYSLQKVQMIIQATTAIVEQQVKQRFYKYFPQSMLAKVKTQKTQEFCTNQGLDFSPKNKKLKNFQIF